MKLMVGLGNPGREYDGTPHNAGFEVVDKIAREAGLKMKKSWRFPMESAQFRVEEHEVLLVKPQTFMNRSGDLVAPLLRKKGVTPADVLVLVDDVELPLGTVRLRAKGSAGTHNGLKSLIERIGTSEFPRLRIGVGPVPAGRDLISFVLGRYPKDMLEKVEELKKRSAEAALYWVAAGIEKAMNKFNG
jgi:peptidyl-tRNA hydrolase, PTH1 family